jgi:hypothetical protein
MIPVVRPAPELTIVVPTFNERANIPLLVERLSHLLTSCDWEVIFAVGAHDRRRTAACVAFAASAGAASPEPASKACWRAKPATSR